MKNASFGTILKHRTLHTLKEIAIMLKKYAFLNQIFPIM